MGTNELIDTNDDVPVIKRDRELGICVALLAILAGGRFACPHSFVRPKPPNVSALEPSCRGRSTYRSTGSYSYSMKWYS
jgi:hypothetical protein